MKSDIIMLLQKSSGHKDIVHWYFFKDFDIEAQEYCNQGLAWLCFGKLYQ